MDDVERPQGGPDVGVPRFATRFVGRRREFAELATDLRDEDRRLVSVVGPGGVGKTRLAAEVAAEVGPRFEDGVVWIELVGMDGPDDVVATLARRLGVEPAEDEPGMEPVLEVLTRRDLLLVLDNCEHLVAVVADLVAAVLTHATDVTVFATSRERLAVPGEHVRELRPLATDGDGAAAALFLDRARQAGGGSPSDEDAASVAEVTRLVDGLPLGIELAAARTRTLGVAQIAAELTERLTLLDEALRVGHPRHRGLVGTLQWSYELLDEDEQRLLEQLAVFRGSFSLDAAATVGAGTLGTTSRGEVVDRLQQLVDKSMVQAGAMIHGSRHYALLDTVRRFARERLERRGRTDEATWLHLQYYRDLLRQVENGLRGGDQLRWVAELESQRDNLRAALQYGLDRAGDGDSDALEVVLELLDSAFWFWGFVEGHGEGRRWGEAALALVTDDVDPAVLASAAWVTGGNCWLVGDRAAGLRWIEEALRLARGPGPDHRRARAGACMMMSRLLFLEGDVEQATAYAAESGELFDTLEDEHRAALGRSVLGVCLGLRGEFPAAIGVLEAVVETFRQHGDDYFLALTLGDLGNVHYFAGNLARAVECTTAALAAARRVGARWMESGQLTWLAELERHRGNLDSAASLLEDVVALAEAASGVHRWRDVHLHLGLVRVAQDAHREAAALLAAALQDAWDKQADATVAASLEALAGVAERLGAVTAAGCFARASRPFRARAGSPRTPAALADHQRVAHLLEDGAAAGHDAEGPCEDINELVRQAQVLAAGPAEVRVQSPWRVRALGLGPVEVYREDRLLQPGDWTYAKPKQVFFLLLEQGPATKEEIGLAIWPEASTAQLTRNLRTAMYHLRNALGARGAVVFDGGRYTVDRMGLWYDVDAFASALAAVDELDPDDHRARAAALAEATALYRGDFLTDLTDESWAAERREELRRRWLRAELERARSLAGFADHHAAADAFRTVLTAEPWDDRAHVGLVEALVAAGDRAAALRHVQGVRESYQDDLGIPLPGAIVELEQAIRDAAV